MKLPRVSASNLNRKRMVFPDDFSGEINLVFIAFLRWHQDLIDEWVPYIEQLAEGRPGLYYYEFPILSDRGFIYRTFLNESMRAGIPSEATRARTITLYLDKLTFREALDIPSEQDIWIYLFTNSGEVLWRIQGEFTEEKGRALRDVLDRHQK
jgi:hypothetical protein